MIFTKDNLEVCLAVSLASYQAWHDKLGDKGFRTLSLSLAGTPSAPLYTSVMVKRDPPFAGQSLAKLSRAELEVKIAELRKLKPPLHPYIVTATGPQNKAIYAASFRRAATEPIFVPDLSPQDVVQVNAAQHMAGNILIWMDAFGTAENVRYCALWARNDDRLAWNADPVDDTGKPLQQRIDAMTSVRARPELVALTPAGGLAALYVDNHLLRPWQMTPTLSAAELNARRATEAKAGRFPVRIASASVGDADRFAAIFAGTDEVVQRKFRARGPDPIDLSAADQVNAQSIDDWMEDYLTTNNFRGAALAIVDGTRLVYAKGYTYAEPAPLYDDVLPTTLFRLGSVSKAFCAVAVWKALADDPKHSRDSLMYKLLGLKKEAPMTDGFKTVTVRHLLESNSGIGQGSVGNILDDRRDNGGKQPLTAPEIAAAVAARPMVGVPGAMKDGKQDTKYGKTDYILLGHVAAQLAGAADFDAALKKLVLDPLHMKRTRGARAKAEDRKPDEARHHLSALDTGPSEVHAEMPRPIVPVQYAGSNCEVYDGAGGVSAAVVDVARLGAMLACRAGNPVLSPATLDAMMSDAVAATAAGSDKGYHGFDSASYKNEADHLVRYDKGGTLGGAGAGINGTTGERVVVIFRNGPNVDGAVNDWKAAIRPIANMIAWGKGDLFPHVDFGMPSL